MPKQNPPPPDPPGAPRGTAREEGRGDERRQGRARAAGTRRAARRPAGRGPRRESSSIVPAIATVLILIALLVFLLVYDDLRSKLWIQGVVGLVLAALVTVILFSVVYSAANVRGAAVWGGVLGISGGALFYLLLLPYVKPFIFPTHPVSGYVYYKTADPNVLRAVTGAVAEVPETGQKSAPTDGSGRFVIDAVYADTDSLLLHNGADTYPVKTAEHPDNRYAVIPPPPDDPLPLKRAPEAGGWKPAPKLGCQTLAERGYARSTGFVFEGELPKSKEEAAGGANVLHLKVRLPGDYGYLSEPDDLAPGNSIDFKEDKSDVEGRTQGWEWGGVGDPKLSVKVTVCVNTKAGDRAPAPDDLQTLYWFGGR
ncbi:MAG TPA: hypothetical protein VNZ44_04445 [Pyrinomonadaceae bacterium]|nr:hypothetical protein [Pyrinomonadaceae bacterium]